MIRSFLEQYYTFIFIVFLVLLTGVSYLLGVEEGKKKGQSGVIISAPQVLEKENTSSVLEISGSIQQLVSPEAQGASAVELLKPQGKYVGSKNGTKYYTPGCPGTNRIKPENYIWFQTAEDATLQGYSKGSC